MLVTNNLTGETKKIIINEVLEILPSQLTEPTLEERIQALEVMELERILGGEF